MDDRQRFALTHPVVTDMLQDQEQMGRYRTTTSQKDGNLLVSVLAVDR